MLHISSRSMRNESWESGLELIWFLSFLEWALLVCSRLWDMYMIYEQRCAVCMQSIWTQAMGLEYGRVDDTIGLMYSGIRLVNVGAF